MYISLLLFMAVVLPGTLAELVQNSRFLSGDKNYVGHQNHILAETYNEGIIYGVTKADCTYGIEPNDLEELFVYLIVQGVAAADRRRLSGDDHDDETPLNVFTEMQEYYEGLTDPSATCLEVQLGSDIEFPFNLTSVTSYCYKLKLNNDVFTSQYPWHFSGNKLEPAGVELFTLAVYELAPDDRRLSGCDEAGDSHNHRTRVLSGDALADFEESMNGRAFPGFAEDVMMRRKLSSAQETVSQFSVRSSQSGALVGGPEATFLNGVMIVAPPTSEDEIGSKGEAYGAAAIVLLVTLSGVFFMIPVVKKFVLVKNVQKADPELADLELHAHVGVEYAEGNGTNGANGTNGDTNGSQVNIDKMPGANGVGTAGAVHTHSTGGKPVEHLHDEALHTLFHPAVLAYASAFAAGAILATSFLLVLPEALGMIWNDVGRDNNDLDSMAWKWGTPILAGILFPWFIAVLLDQALNLIKGPAGMTDEFRIVSGILIGDFFHNFTDGTFIAAAFLSCSKDFGWAVAVSTIIHEIAQEIADFFVLTTICKMNPWKALALNFLGGTSVILGVIVIAESNINQDSLGYFLAFGGGVYIAIGATECMPRIFQYSKGFVMFLVSFLLFSIGAVAIGLILLDHKHCEVGDAHDGHNH